MGLFGRKAKGRHALGAAVTSIPSGPPPVAVAAPAYEARVAPAAPPYEAPVPARQPARQSAPATTAEAVSQLLVTGEWVAGSEAPVDPEPGVAVRLLAPAGPEQHLPAMHLQPFPVPAPSAAAVAPSVVAMPPPAGAPPAVAPRAPLAAPGRSSLDAALAELLPSQESAAAEAAEGAVLPSRVQLGFRDGTSAPLDPGSRQFAELEALAQSLTQRD